MKVLVVGLGSMGRRRIHLMREYFPRLELYGVDISEDRRKRVEDEFHIFCYDSIPKLLKAQPIQVGFVCTSPETHEGIIKELLAAGLDVFTEINLLTQGYQEIEQLAAEKNKLVFVSSTPMYRREVQTLINLMNQQEKPVAYRYHIGQYLPDWHPWEDYRNFFASKKATNGCREILAIQLPWMLQAFGEVENIAVSKRKTTKLPLDFEDSYLVLMEHKNGTHGVFQADIVARKAVSSLEVVGEDIQIRWDGTPQGLQQLNLETKEFEKVSLYEKVQHDQNYTSNIIEDAYLEEIRDFFSTLEGKGSPRHSLGRDKAMLELIDQIETQAQ